MKVLEKKLEIPLPTRNDSPILSQIRETIANHLSKDDLPIRFVVTESTSSTLYCELGFLREAPKQYVESTPSIFSLVPRHVQNTSSFNAALVVPTGIGAEIGGHAGDATPVAKLVSTVCDNLVIHPNIVNASDINEMPSNCLYVEGSIMTRLFLGNIALQPVRKNRVLVVVEDHSDQFFVSAAINSVNGAMATYGFHCPEIVRLNPTFSMQAAYTESGRAAGTVADLETLFHLLQQKSSLYDAVALTSVIKVPYNYHLDYFTSEGKMINPWGGIEALLTHSISTVFNKPSAHSPMFESQMIANIDPGVVDPRMASEAVSVTFLQCILKGLHQSPRLITDSSFFGSQGTLSCSDLSCLIIPDGCIGIPTLAALDQDIPVIAVKENQNIMNNDLTVLPWKEGQLHFADNYLEAVGILSGLKAGLSPSLVRRPLEKIPVTKFESGVRPNETPKLSGKPAEVLTYKQKDKVSVS